MKRRPMISIISPTLNEARNIEILIREIFKYGKGLRVEVIIIDDDSSDKTASIVDSLSKTFDINLIVRKGMRGLSSAVMDGFAAAKGEIIGVIDADLSHPPELIPKMVKKIMDGSDIVFGSRLLDGGKVEEWPIHRKMISGIATLLSKPLVDISDPMSGFFFFKRKVIEGINLTPIGYKIGLEILVKGNYKKVTEIPYTFTNRGHGTSKLGMYGYLEFLRHLTRLYRYKIFR